MADITPIFPIVSSAELPGGILDVATNPVDTPSGTLVQPKKVDTVGGMQPSPTALTQGSGNDIIKISSKGIHLGDALFETAPFSVDMQGNLKATSAIISGDITAITGHIANWTISSSALYTGAFQVAGGMYFGSSGLSLSDTFSVTSEGVLRAVSGNIAGWDLSTSALSTGTFDTLNTMYFGTSGLSLSNVFKVTSAGALTASSGVIGGFTITPTELYGGIIKTAATVGAGSDGVIMDTAGIRMYDADLGMVVNIPSDGSRPSFSSGDITLTNFTLETALAIRTADTVGDGSIDSAGVLINNAGIFVCEASQLLADANVKFLIDGSAVIKMNVKGGQTDFATGTGYFLGLSGGDYKFSVGSDTSYLRWNGTQMILKGSFDVGTNGLINNAIYTVANLLVSPTAVGFSPPSAYE